MAAMSETYGNQIQQLYVGPHPSVDGFKFIKSGHTH